MSGPALERLRQGVNDTQSSTPAETQGDAPEGGCEPSAQDAIPNFLPDLIDTIVEGVRSAAYAPGPRSASPPGLGPMVPPHMQWPGMPMWPHGVRPGYRPMVPPAMVPVLPRRGLTGTQMLLGGAALAGLAWLLSRGGKEEDAE